MILWERVRYLCSYAPCKLWTLRTDTPFSLHNNSCFSGHSGLIATILANASQILAPEYSSCLAIWGGAARWCSGNHLESNIFRLYTHHPVLHEIHSLNCWLFFRPVDVSLICGSDGYIMHPDRYGSSFGTALSKVWPN
jgi:hypothetical protein